MQPVQYIQSKLLSAAGVRHGWFLRHGGVSSGEYKSLNGKKGMADSDDNVEENRRRAVKKLTGNEHTPYAHIIHNFKTNILHATEAGEFQHYDASITTTKNLILSQTTADCGTVIIADTVASVIALVHGSWHTVSANIICDVVAKIKEHTTHDLIAALGPMACEKCYEFGPEAVDIFDEQYLTHVNGKYLVHLRAIIKDQLASSGVSRVDDIGICTIESLDFFSARRNGAKSGRFITLATL